MFQKDMPPADVSVLDFNFYCRLLSLVTKVCSERLNEILPMLIEARQQAFKKLSANGNEENENLYSEAVANLVTASARLRCEALSYAMFKLDVDYPLFARTASAL